MTTTPDLRFPVGKFQRPAGPLSAAERAKHIETLAATPALIANGVKGLNEKQLDTPYRDGGWTVRQVVHHVADSHMNAYIRIKFALTEVAPLVKPYDEDAWAKLSDSFDTPADVSVTMITALHDRWVRLMRKLNQPDFERTLTHPEHGPITVDFLLALYAWHGPHHAAHISGLRQRSGW